MGAAPDQQKGLSCHTLPAFPSLFKHAPANRKALFDLSTSVKQSSLGERLVELINLRISQINACGFCVDMHWRDLIRQDVDEPLQAALVKQKVDVKVVIVDLDAFLAGNEGKVRAQFQQKIFRLAVLQAEEVQHAGVFQHQRRRYFTVLAQLGQFRGEQPIGLARQGVRSNGRVSFRSRKRRTLQRSWLHIWV